MLADRIYLVLSYVRNISSPILYSSSLPLWNGNVLPYNDFSISGGGENCLRFRPDSQLNWLLYSTEVDRPLVLVLVVKGLRSLNMYVRIYFYTWQIVPLLLRKGPLFYTRWYWDSLMCTSGPKAPSVSLFTTRLLADCCTNSESWSSICVLEWPAALLSYIHMLLRGLKTRTYLYLCGRGGSSSEVVNEWKEEIREETTGLGSFLLSSAPVLFAVPLRLVIAKWSCTRFMSP